MSNNPELSVGREVYLRPVGDNARRGNTEPVEYLIKKVGRKYFEVWDGKMEYTTVKFNISDRTQTTEYAADWMFYFTKQEILDEIEFESLRWDISKVFKEYGRLNLTLDQLRRIKSVLDESPA